MKGRSVASEFLVYRSEGAHLWRFVHQSNTAASHRDALDEASALAREFGNDAAGLYMVVPLAEIRAYPVLDRDAAGTQTDEEAENRA